MAATSRTFTLIVRVLPSRSNSCSCENPEQLGLQFQRNVAHLVQEKRPLVRQLKPAKLLADRPGECAFLVAEQLALQQPGGDRRAIQFHERAALARAQVMHRPGNEFLARAGFPADQDGGVGGGDRRDLLEDGKERGLSPMMSPNSCSVRTSSSR